MNKINFLMEVSKYQSSLITMPSNQYNELIFSIPKELSNKKICYITLNKTYSSLKERFQQENIHSDDIVFIDAISSRLHKVQNTEDCYFISSPQALTELSIVISEFLKQQFDYVVFDSLNTLITYQKSRKPVMKFTSSIVNKICNSDCKALIYVIKGEDQFIIDEVSMIVDHIIDVENFQNSKHESSIKEDFTIENYL